MTVGKFRGKIRMNLKTIHQELEEPKMENRELLEFPQNVQACMGGFDKEEKNG